LDEPDIKSFPPRLWYPHLGCVKIPPRTGLLRHDPGHLRKVPNEVRDSLSKWPSLPLSYNGPNLSPFLSSPHTLISTKSNFYFLSQDVYQHTCCRIVVFSADQPFGVPYRSTMCPCLNGLRALPMLSYFNDRKHLRERAPTFTDQICSSSLQFSN
jgi:hypothetical protein